MSKKVKRAVKMAMKAHKIKERADMEIVNLRAGIEKLVKQMNIEESFEFDRRVKSGEISYVVLLRLGIDENKQVNKLIEGIGDE